MLVLGPHHVYQDFSMCHDQIVKIVIVNLQIRLKGNLKCIIGAQTKDIGTAFRPGLDQVCDAGKNKLWLDGPLGSNAYFTKTFISPYKSTCNIFISYEAALSPFQQDSKCHCKGSKYDTYQTYIIPPPSYFHTFH